ncbi:uncharacterized protein LOC113147155 [Cyclospora cayetanensis]|uniref:Uncharacterized protein LOC113147155 n=1 Tax=Cyclospora cayetanensis TaxID=88456 RepID=A0A6P6RX63_9EIME|nr:uncharacterized protein LOC113147155 [Cyclospora cayetanensis]
MDDFHHGSPEGAVPQGGAAAPTGSSPPSVPTVGGLSSGPLPRGCFHRENASLPLGAPAPRAATQTSMVSGASSATTPSAQAANQQLGGITSVLSISEARASVYSCRNAPVVLVCGWPRGLRIFLHSLLQNGLFNVLILCPHSPNTVGPLDLAPYARCCAYICGSALSMTDLLRAGALEATAVAIFSSPQVSWRADLSSSKLDTQALLVRRTILALYKRGGPLPPPQGGLPPVLEAQEGASIGESNLLQYCDFTMAEAPEYDSTPHARPPWLR